YADQPDDIAIFIRERRLGRQPVRGGAIGSPKNFLDLASSACGHDSLVIFHDRASQILVRQQLEIVLADEAAALPADGLREARVAEQYPSSSILRVNRAWNGLYDLVQEGRISLQLFYWHPISSPMTARLSGQACIEPPDALFAIAGRNSRQPPGTPRVLEMRSA